MSLQRRAVVLHGATAERPDEADTIVQAEQVAAALAGCGWQTEIGAVGLDLGALDQLLTPRPYLVFNLVEALAGDGRLIHLVPAALEHLGIAFSGASAQAHFVTTCKPLAKKLLRGAGLPTPDWWEPNATVLPAGELGRFIVKPVWEDASFGIDRHSVVPAAQLPEELARRAARLGGAWFAEAYIEGREFNVGLLETAQGLAVLPIAEIVFLDYPPDRPRIVDYEAKWQEDSFAYHHTPRRFDLPVEDGPLLATLRTLAQAAFQDCGLRGYGRVDFRVDGDGRPWILEVNANPCLADDGGFMAAAGHASLRLEDVVTRIVASIPQARGAAAA